MVSAVTNQGVMNCETGALEPAEVEWIHAARNGDLDAFNRLVIRYQDGLCGWVASIVNDTALAEDVTQATFLAAYEKLHTYRNGSFKAWLFTIARNRSLDALRRKKRHPTLYFEGDPAEERDRLELLPDQAPLPEESVLAAEQAERIELILSRLPESFQQVVRLVDMEGLDYQDAARILNLRMGTLKSQLSRARAKLRILFEQARWV